MVDFLRKVTLSRIAVNFFMVEAEELNIDIARTNELEHFMINEHFRLLNIQFNDISTNIFPIN